MKISDGYVVYVAGIMGMGKTRFIKGFIERKVDLYPQYNIYNLDTKKQGDFTAADGTLIISEQAPDAYTTSGNRMVWQPVDDNQETYSKFFSNILKAGKPAIVNIDETVNMKFGDSVPRGMKILLSQARLPGICVIGGTQEVANSPRLLLSQARYIVSFSLTNKYDQNEMIQKFGLVDGHGKPLKSLGLKKYQFYMIDKFTETVARKYNTYQDAMKLIH